MAAQAVRRIFVTIQNAFPMEGVPIIIRRNQTVTGHLCRLLMTEKTQFHCFQRCFGTVQPVGEMLVKAVGPFPVGMAADTPSQGIRGDSGFLPENTGDWLQYRIQVAIGAAGHIFFNFFGFSSVPRPCTLAVEFSINGAMGKLFITGGFLDVTFCRAVYFGKIRMGYFVEIEMTVSTENFAMHGITVFLIINIK